MPDLGPIPTPMRHGSSSDQPVTRLDGVLKVTGAATYAADNRPEGLLHAVVATSTIARGRVARLDVAAAKARPGVVEVITPGNRPALAQDWEAKPTRFSYKVDILHDDRVRYANQPIALVLAETLEAATEGARLLAPAYEAEPARIGLDDDEAYAPELVGIGFPPSFERGDVEAGLADAAHRTEAVYETPRQYHNAMEPHAIVAAWEGDRLTIDTPNQALALTREAYATWFDMSPENVTIRSPFLGGGFGSKAILAGPHILAPLAARMLGRPVKLVFTRAQMFGSVGHRGATRQTLRLGTDAEGRLTALDHHAVAATSAFDEFVEPAAGVANSLYASAALRSGHTAVRTDVGTPGPVRAPGKASGSAAVECAIDEAAHAAGLDPLAFRLRNYAETDPASGKPFSSKALRACYEQGAERFGWASRPLEPRRMRDADGLLVGWGMGTALFPSPMFAAEAEAVLDADGTATVSTGACDMGQGAWTALAQIAAEGIGLDLDAVTFRSGSSDLPDGGIAGGSGHTATAGQALFAAGRDVVAKLAEIATNDTASPLFGLGNAGVVARGGHLRASDDESRADAFADILARAGIERIEGRGTGSRDPASAEEYAMFAHGAVFAEVKIDPDLCQMRVTRLVGAFAAGRIVNEHLTRSQLQGGMIWGLSFALHEDAAHDPRTGRPMNGDLGGYHVPVNADAPSVTALTVHEDDPHVNALGIKGVGEIGITGSVGAIANAVWHATGRRVRRFPIRIEDLVA